MFFLVKQTRWLILLQLSWTNIPFVLCVMIPRQTFLSLPCVLMIGETCVQLWFSSEPLSQIFFVEYGVGIMCRDALELELWSPQLWIRQCLYWICFLVECCQSCLGGSWEGVITNGWRARTPSISYFIACLIARALNPSFARSLHRSIAHSVAPSLHRWIALSSIRSIHCSVVRLFGRSISIVCLIAWSLDRSIACCASRSA